MKTYRRLRASWIIPRLPLIVATVAGIACSDSTAPTVVPARYRLTLNKTSAVVGDTVLVEAQLVDANDRGVTGVIRNVAWVPNGGGGSFTDARTLTDSRGVATNRFLVGTKPSDGTTIFVIDDKLTQGESPAISVVAGEPGSYTVTSSSSAAPANTRVSLSAQLADRYGNPIPIAGRVVSWLLDVDECYSCQIDAPASHSVIPAGAVRPTAPTRARAASLTGTLASTSSTTNSQGVATMDFDVGTTLTAYTIVVRDNEAAVGKSGAIQVTSGPLAKLVVTLSVTDPPAGAGVSLVVYPTDAYDNPVMATGTRINWSATGSGGSLGFPFTDVSTDGTSTNVLTTSSIPGTTHTVTASIFVGSGKVSGTSASITTLEQLSLSSLAAGFGSQSSCGIANDGKVWCWGSQLQAFSSRDVPGKPIGNQTMSALSVGVTHACGISSGTVLCWGSNAQGELGDNSRTSRSTPAPISSSLSFSAISIGGAHSCALATTGETYCWGLPDSGRLGDGGGSTGATPIKVAGSLTFSAVSAGHGHTCAIATSGDAYCWGLNDHYQLGDGATANASTPTLVIGGLKFTAIAAGLFHTCGLAAGTIYCWGDNTFGQLGEGSTTPRAKPTAVKGTATFVAVAAGGAATCAIASDARAYCWGDNSTGELGDPNSGPGHYSALPRTVSGLTFKSIAVGGTAGFADFDGGASAEGHACGITTSGVTYCWGSNGGGELGISSSGPPSFSPAKVSGQQ